MMPKWNDESNCNGRNDNDIDYEMMKVVMK